MKTKNKTIKSILSCATACSALALGGVGAMNLNNSNYNVSAYEVDNIAVSITNPNFNSNTSSNYPYSPNGYSAYSYDSKVTSVDSVNSNVQAGVINLSHEDYETRFSLAKRTSLDNYVLMIDSTDKENPSILHTINYGFRTSSALSLDANSKYMITVDVFTATNSNIASLYLYDSNGDVFSSIEKVKSYNSWTTYSFFVSTNSMEKLSLNLGMYLDGAGVVLFDNLSAFKMSEREYDFSLNSSASGTFAEKNGIDNVLETYSINALGQLESSSTEKTNFTSVEYQIENNHSLSHVQDSDGRNSYALLLENYESTYASYETESIITFEPNRVYQISVSAKTKDLNGTATLTLERTDIDKNDSAYSTDYNKTISITSNTYSSSTQSVTNDYSIYSFYVVSHPSKATTYKLVFGLGSSEELTSGKLYLSEIEISKINYDVYSSASSSNQISLVNAYKDSSIMLDNGDFNAFKIADYNSPIPATPLNWDVTVGKNTQAYGVVNTATFSSDLSSLNLSNLRNPSQDNNNVLMMYNETADSLVYTSTSKKLDAKSYHKFEVDVQTQNASLLVELVTKKDDKEVVLSSKTITTSSSWQTVTMFIRSGYQSMDVSMKLSLITSDYGYAYVDNAKFNYLLTASQVASQFNEANESSNVSKVDLTNMISSSTNNKYAPSQIFSSETTAGVESGTVTLLSSYLDEVITGEENITTFNSIANGETDKKALAIWSTDDVNYTLTSNVGYALTTGSYYKVTVDLFTQNLGTNNNEASKDKVGVSIGLTNYENSFVGLKSDNVWTTYTFYIKAETSSTVYLELSLGNEDALTKGCAFFTNITFDDSITEDEYKAVNEYSTVKLLTTKTQEDDSDKDTTDSTSKENASFSSSTWIYLIPSLLTVLAIVIAIIGFLARKIKWKNPFKKKSKTSYDRNKTVSVQYYTRKATTLREEKVRELTQDLNRIQAERKKYEDDYKQSLTKLREMKIRRENPTEISKLEKELKKSQKMSANLGVTANRISEDLKYAKTDMYLNSLIKKLARESSSTNSNESEDGHQDK